MPFPVDRYMARVPPEPEGQLPKHDFPPALAASSLFSAVGREGSHTQHCLCTVAVTAISPSFSVTWHRQNSICRCVRYTMRLMIDNVPTTQSRWQPLRYLHLRGRSSSFCRTLEREPVPWVRPFVEPWSRDSKDHRNGCATRPTRRGVGTCLFHGGAVRMRLDLGQTRSWE